MADTQARDPTHDLEVADGDHEVGVEVEMDEDTKLYIHTQRAILAASNLDIDGLRNVLDENGANVQDPETLVTPLHAAISSLIIDDSISDQEDGNVEAPSSEKAAAAGSLGGNVGGEGEKKTEIETDKIPAAVEIVRLLLENGAVWSDLDANDETAGCLASRLGLDEIYSLIVEAGVRAELLLRLQGYFLLQSDDEGEEEDDDEEDGDENNDDGKQGGAEETKEPRGETATDEAKDMLSNTEYLANPLPSTLPSGDLIDADSNAVMMGWETPLMEAHAAALLPRPGLRILNIGHGMGIFDSIVRDRYFPSAHHIIEAHPTVIARMSKAGWTTGSHPHGSGSSQAGVAQSTLSTEPPAATGQVDVHVHQGTWQTHVPLLVTAIQDGTLAPFDAVYYDTFAETYDDFRDFASSVPILLGRPDDQTTSSTTTRRLDGRFGFFFGSGADRQVCYDVYTRIAEIDMNRIGFDTAWTDIPVGADLERDGVWENVSRPYWKCKIYRMPTCSFKTVAADSDGQSNEEPRQADVDVEAEEEGGVRLDG